MSGADGPRETRGHEDMATFTDTQIIEGYQYSIDGVDCDRATNEIAEDVHKYLVKLHLLLDLHAPDWFTVGEQMDLGAIVALAGELVRRTNREIDVVESMELVIADAVIEECNRELIDWRSGKLQPNGSLEPRR